MGFLKGIDLLCCDGYIEFFGVIFWIVYFFKVIFVYKKYCINIKIL